jgi:hypothetical protein
MQKLPDEFVGALQRRLNGIIDKIENGGLEYNYAMSGLQMVSEGRVQLPTQTASIESVNTAVVGRLKLISGDKKITVAATDGTETLANTNDVFYYIDNDFRNWGTNVAGKRTVETTVQVYEMIKDGNFSQIYGGFGENLDRLCLSQAQIKVFCRDHRGWLRKEGYGSFFLFKVGTEFFVASVRVYSDGYLYADVDRLSYGFVWRADDRLRFVFPQLTLEN